MRLNVLLLKLAVMATRLGGVLHRLFKKELKEDEITDLRKETLMSPGKTKSKIINWPNRLLLS